ncbi:MAG TPA: class I SAM-dependent methyltransferase [Candidatus Angelobacter sp.]|nr:class I SAM-dependent methyltransferase [Candidatus Angelobacter sp.]
MNDSLTGKKPAPGLPANSESQRIIEAYNRRDQALPPGRYSSFEISHLLLQQELERRILRVLGSRTHQNLAGRRILEVGCGSGRWLRQFIQWGAAPEDLAGVDLLPDRIVQAHKLCPAGVHLECGDASHLAFESQSFDIVFQAMAFTSILSGEVKGSVAQEMLRVLRKDGFVLWYDFFVNNPRNPDVRGVGKTELRELFPGCLIQCARVTLAPPIGRLLGRFSESAYRFVSALRFASTHFLAVIEKP